jgi:hypothetical protein
VGSPILADPWTLAGSPRRRHARARGLSDGGGGRQDARALGGDLVVDRALGACGHGASEHCSSRGGMAIGACRPSSGVLNMGNVVIGVGAGDTVEEACQWAATTTLGARIAATSWDGMAASWAPYGLHSSAIVDSGGRGGIGIIQAGVLGSGNTALDADDDNGLLVTISSGPGAGGGGHSSHLATVLDGGA